MKCDKCGREGVNYISTLIVNGEKSSIHLCEECATQQGLLKTHKARNLATLFYDTAEPTSIFDKVDSIIDNVFAPPLKDNYIEDRAEDAPAEDAELERLREQLQLAIEEERYEDAGVLSKKIKNMLKGE